MDKDTCKIWNDDDEIDEIEDKNDGDDDNNDADKLPDKMMMKLMVVMTYFSLKFGVHIIDCYVYTKS